MNLSEKGCPVPLEQRPLNEYLALKNSMFFFWTMKPFLSYIKRVVVFSAMTYAITSGLVISSGELNFSHIFFYTLIFGNITLFIFFLRFYLAWVYIYKRLIDATVSYEESGWYDCQTWIKTPETLVQDTLIAQYELLPIISRLKETLLTLGFIMISSTIYIKAFV
nr:photosystem I assembly protein Ycf36 [Chroomonas debatzensis]